ncbi:hypothetical protein GQ457_07G015050 [Hibiscus cannabinus]
MKYNPCFQLLSVLSIQCFMVCLAITVRNLTTDQSALVQFKDRIVDPQNVLTNSWKASSSVCKWVGVSCGVIHERVVALNLTTMSLAGTIPPHLGNLSFLLSLDLSSNHFYGHLPNELGHLHRLRVVRFSFNSLNGEIPSWLGNLYRVKMLMMRSNNFTGTVPRTLVNMSNLKILDLGFNQLFGQIPSSNDLCVHLPKLEILALAANEISGCISSIIGECNNLQILELSGNKFSGTIPRSIGNLTQLKELYLGLNNLEGNLISLEILSIQQIKGLIGPIPTSIFNISSLGVVDLSNNSLSDGLPDDLCRHLPKLEVLLLGENQLSGYIPSNIGKCSNLKVLSLLFNQFSGIIPISIGNLTQLKELDLESNNLEGGIPEEFDNLFSLEILNIRAFNKGFTVQISTSIFNISSLKFLDLAHNRLSGSLPDNLCHHLHKLEGLFLEMNELYGNIPSSIGECYKLQIMWLSHNQFSGLIPKSIWNSTNLKYIYLHDNKLEGNLPPMTRAPKLEELLAWGNKLSGNIPSYISNASVLRQLSLQKNFFSGQIPDALGNLRHLEGFKVYNNHLTTEPATHEWSFLSSLANCRNLTNIVVSGNPLKGVLPTYIGNLSTSLRYFSVHNCELKGNIPTEIGNLSSMLDLELANNGFSGSIPTSIGGLRNLQSWDLSSNKLRGPISESVCGLESLYALSLSSNELHGPVLACLGNMTSLRYLYLDSNKLTSAIPSTLLNLKDILVLDLSSNYLNNSLALDVGNLRSLLLLNLSRNLLTGDISSTIGGLLTLLSLDLSNNKLHGHIPESFGDLISLGFLDLSNNNLSGFIPKSLEKLLFLNHFNVSFNRLEGEIPTNGCFPNFSSTSFMNNYALCGPPRLLVPPCKNNIHTNSKMLKLHALTYGLSTIGIVIVLIVLTITYRKYRSRSTALQINDNLLSLRTWRRISHAQLSQATNGFEESNLLGSGSFGCVYRGRLSDGMEVAIKVFNLQLEGAFRSFDIECEAMRNILHRNLVRIITCCSNIDFKALVFDFMSNGNVATALEHLHTGHPTPIIHCDLKPSNILLDDDMVAHVGDFGIAKLLGEGDVMKQTMTLATIGYMAPEFGSTGIVSVKSDVYSYGIILIETFTKKRPTDETFAEEMTIRHWMKGLLSKGMIDIADAELLRREDEYFVVKANCISSIMKLALDCSAELPEERKDMKDVVVELKRIKQRFLNSIDHMFLLSNLRHVPHQMITDSLDS